MVDRLCRIYKTLTCDDDLDDMVQCPGLGPAETFERYQYNQLPFKISTLENGPKLSKI